MVLLTCAELAIVPLLATSCVEGAKPTLKVIGSKYFENDGVEPLEGPVKGIFTFAIRYIDPDGQAPKNGYPRILIDTDHDGKFGGGNDLNLTMDRKDFTQGSYQLGVDYAREWTFDEPGTYSYAFFVDNTRNETAFIGPFDGPIVRRTQSSDQATTSGLIGLLVFVLSVTFLVVGIGIGQQMERKQRRRLFEAHRSERK